MSKDQAIPEAHAIAGMSSSHQPTRDVCGIPTLIVPDDYNVMLLERTMSAPNRKRGTVTLNDEASFLAVVKENQSTGTRLFHVVRPSPSFTAIFNFGHTEPGWRDHRAHYALPMSPEWLVWTQGDGPRHARNQVDMVRFFETNMENVVEPDGASMLEICRTLEAKKSVEFVSSTRLTDGSTEFTYNEEVKGSAQKGTVQIPEMFTIGIQVVEGGESFAIKARFRYRIDGSKLTMWYELVNPHKVVETVVKEMRERIAAETGLQVLNGEAPRIDAMS